MRKVRAIVPAAGLSRRFGGPNKLLQAYDESTIVATVARTLRDAGLDPLVVTGRDSDLVASEVRPSNTVFNSCFEQGLGTSIAAGVAACGEVDGFLIALGDMPGLRREILEALILKFESLALEAIVSPAYESEPDRSGHPILFGSAHRAALEGLGGDEGARSIIRANRDWLVLVPVAGSLVDVDVPPNLS